MVVKEHQYQMLLDYDAKLDPYFELAQMIFAKVREKTEKWINGIVITSKCADNGKDQDQWFAKWLDYF